MRVVFAGLWLAGAIGVAVGCGGPRTVGVTVEELAAPAIAARPHSLAVWTGDGAIVFGGWSRLTEGWWTDGAHYDMTTAEWRVIAPFPYPDAQPEAVAWTGEEMIVVAIEGEYPLQSTIVSASYQPSSDTWQPEVAPETLVTARPQTRPDVPASLYSSPGPPAVGVDGRVFVVAKGKLLSWHPDDRAWTAPQEADDRLDRFDEASAPVEHDGIIYQGLARRESSRHGLLTIDAATGEILAVEELNLPSRLGGDIVGPLHPLFDGDELLLLGVESVGSHPRKATVLERDQDEWSIAAQTDDENFAGVGPSGYRTLVEGDDALYSLHFNRVAGVFTPSDRDFGILDLDEQQRCALADGSVWTGTALFGWNGGHCRDEPIHEFQPSANMAVLIEQN